MVKTRVSSVRRSIVAARPKNQLLAALPIADYRRILPDLKTVRTSARQVFQKQGTPIEHVWFLNGGVGSVTTVLTDGTTVEAATVGNEGLLGIEAFFSDRAISPGETIMQVPDTDAEVMGIRAFRRELARHGAFHDLIGRFAQVTIAQMMQSTACNAIHQVQERCCRWLLMTHDRMHQQDFHLSHEFLAVMLGVRRQTVTVVAGGLQHAGLIRYTHGRVSILDRKALEKGACECYAVIRKCFDELLEDLPSARE
jgi:CRP-like cAMP-binding protein